MRKSKKIIKGNAKLEQMPLNILMDLITSDNVFFNQLSEEETK